MPFRDGPNTVRTGHILHRLAFATEQLARISCLKPEYHGIILWTDSDSDLATASVIRGSLKTVYPYDLVAARMACA